MSGENVVMIREPWEFLQPSLQLYFCFIYHSLPILLQRRTALCCAVGLCQYWPSGVASSGVAYLRWRMHAEGKSIYTARSATNRPSLNTD